MNDEDRKLLIKYLGRKTLRCNAAPIRERR